MHLIARVVYDLAHDWCFHHRTVLPSVLLFGVLHTWSCGVMKLVKHISSTADAKTASAAVAALVLNWLQAGAAAVCGLLQVVAIVR